MEEEEEEGEAKRPRPCRPSHGTAGSLCRGPPQTLFYFSLFLLMLSCFSSPFNGPRERERLDAPSGASLLRSALPSSDVKECASRRVPLRAASLLGCFSFCHQPPLKENRWWVFEAFTVSHSLAKCNKKKKHNYRALRVISIISCSPRTRCICMRIHNIVHCVGVFVQVYFYFFGLDFSCYPRDRAH